MLDLLFWFINEPTIEFHVILIWQSKLQKERIDIEEYDWWQERCYKFRVMQKHIYCQLAGDKILF